MLTRYIQPYHRNQVQHAPQGALTLLDTVPWIDRLFRDNFDDLLHGSTGLEFDEKEGVYTTSLDLAGYKREEIKIEVVDGTVTITAENKKRGKSVRSFYLSDVDPEKIQAKLEDGCLSISLPKYPEKLPKRIEIA